MAKLNKSIEWYTPPEIIYPLGKFDLDPCSSPRPPVNIADKFYTKEDNGLVLPWTGRVWLNPPYGRLLIHWVKKMFHHRNGISLLFNRSDTVKPKRKQ